MNSANYVISGAILVASWAIGVCFMRFHRRQGERLFAFFAWCFWLMAIERLLLIFISHENEGRPYIYLIRLTAFLLLVYGIYDKNSRSAGRSEN